MTTDEGRQTTGSPLPEGEGPGEGATRVRPSPVAGRPSAVVNSVLDWRRDALGLAMVALDSFAFTAAANIAFLVNGVVADSPPPGVFFAVLFSAYAAARLLPQSRLPLGKARAAGAALAVAVLWVAVWNQYGRGYAPWDPEWLGAFLYRLRSLLNPIGPEPAEVVGVIALGLGWWRGASLAVGTNTFERALFALRLGVIAYAIDLALAGAGGVETPVGATVVPYIGLGILTLALARQSRIFEERKVPVQPTWLAIAVAAILGLVGTGALVALVFGLEIFDLLLGLAALVEASLGMVLYRVFLLLGYVAEFLVHFLRERAAQNLRFPTPELAPTPTPAPEAPPEAPPLVPPVVGEALNWLLLVVLLAAGVVGLALALRRASRPAEEEDEGEREPLNVAGGLRRDLRELLRRRVGRRGPRRSAEAADPVRALYRRLLARAAVAGAARRPDETPYEFEPKADRVLPPALVDPLTDAYVRVRYGEEAIDPEELARLKNEWDARA